MQNQFVIKSYDAQALFLRLFYFQMLFFGLISALPLLAFSADKTSAQPRCNITSSLICTLADGNSWSNAAFTEATPIIMDAERVTLSKGKQTFAFDLASGEMIWTARAPHDSHYFYPIHNKRPAFNLDEAADSTVYLARSDGTIEKRNAQNGAPIWERKLANGWVYPPVLLENQIITAGQDRTLWQIDAKNGQILNQRPLAQELVAPLFQLDQTSYAVSTFDAQLHAYQANSPTPVWSFALPAAGFAFDLNKETLIISSMDGMLTALNIKTGHQVWQQKLHENAQFWNLVDNNTLYSLNRSGDLYLLNTLDGSLQELRHIKGHFDRAPYIQGKQLALYNTSKLNQYFALSEQ